MKKKILIDRRFCLQGIGASLALPLFDAMGWAESDKPATSKPPVRLGFMYMPHGVIMDQFWPKDPDSFLSSPPPALESLRPVLDQCLLMKGISGVSIAPFNGAPHALELSTWLTATLPDADTRSQINIAISADQIAANYVGAYTSLPSLELATMPQTHKENQEGLNEGYYSHCSFRSPTQAVPAEINPRSVLKRLFSQQGEVSDGRRPAQTDALDRNMLDLVIGGARDLRRTLPRNDQHKLDEYLDSVRSVERRIAAIEFGSGGAAYNCVAAAVALCFMQEPSTDGPTQVGAPETRVVSLQQEAERFVGQPGGVLALATRVLMLQRLSRYAELTPALQALIAATRSIDTQTNLYRQLGNHAAEHISDFGLAEDSYNQVLQRRAGDVEALYTEPYDARVITASRA